MVEVFRTNVCEERDAIQLFVHLQKTNPQYKVNFDLDDCDKILRIESSENVDSENIIFLLGQFGFKGEILPDN